MSIPLTTADLSTTSSNLKALIDERFTLREAIAESGAAIIGKTLWDKYASGRLTRTSVRSWIRTLLP